MSLFLAVITFFLLIIILMCVKENTYYLLLMAFMGMFITFSLSDIFNSGVDFTHTVGFSGGATQQFWLQLFYGFFTLIAFGRAAVAASKNKVSMEVQ